MDTVGSIADLGLRFLAEPQSHAPPVNLLTPDAVVPAPRCGPGCAGADTSSAALLTYRRTERTTLMIETQEGDTVRLKIKVKDSLTAAAATDNDTLISELAVSGRSSIKIRFSVEGDLNAAELAAIRDVVEQAGALAEQFFAGELPDTFATAAALEIDGTQLANVGLRLSVREQLTYSASGTYRPLPAAPAPTVPGPAAPALPPPPSAEAGAAPAPTVAPAPAAEPPAPVASAAPPQPAAVVDAPPSPAPASPPAPPAPAPDLASAVLGTIADFLDELLDALAPPADGEPAGGGASISIDLKLRVFQSIVFTLAATQRPAPEENTETSGLPLLAATLDAVAAQQNPLDVRA